MSNSQTGGRHVLDNTEGKGERTTVASSREASVYEGETFVNGYLPSHAEAANNPAVVRLQDVDGVLHACERAHDVLDIAQALHWTEDGRVLLNLPDAENWELSPLLSSVFRAFENQGGVKLPFPPLLRLLRDLTTILHVEDAESPKTLGGTTKRLATFLHTTFSSHCTFVGVLIRYILETELNKENAQNIINILAIFHNLISFEFPMEKRPICDAFSNHEKFYAFFRRTIHLVGVKMGQERILRANLMQQLVEFWILLVDCNLLGVTRYTELLSVFIKHENFKKLLETLFFQIKKKNQDAIYLFKTFVERKDFRTRISVEAFFDIREKYFAHITSSACSLVSSDAKDEALFQMLEILVTFSADYMMQVILFESQQQRSGVMDLISAFVNNCERLVSLSGQHEDRIKIKEIVTDIFLIYLNLDEFGCLFEKYIMELYPTARARRKFMQHLQTLRTCPLLREENEYVNQDAFDELDSIITKFESIDEAKTESHETSDADGVKTTRAQARSTKQMVSYKGPLLPLPKGKGWELLEVPHHFKLPQSLRNFYRREQMVQELRNTNGGNTPPPYTLLKRNVYYHRRSVLPPSDSALVCSCLYIPGVNACELGCLNRMSCVECSPQHCPCKGFCSNQRFQRAEYADVEVFKAGEKGWGLRSKQLIHSGDFVIEYIGEVVTEEECKRRLERYVEEKCTYFLTLGNGEVIDASRKGSLARFINHSCRPNCCTQKWTVRGELRVGIFALEDIAPGEEICFDYMMERQSPRREVCLCGEANCRGFIGASRPGRQPQLSPVDMSDSEEGQDSSAIEVEELGTPPPRVIRSLEQETSRDSCTDWVCTKCTHHNPLTDSLCANCRKERNGNEKEEEEEEGKGQGEGEEEDEKEEQSEKKKASSEDDCYVAPPSPPRRSGLRAKKSSFWRRRLRLKMALGHAGLANIDLPAVDDSGDESIWDDIEAALDATRYELSRSSRRRRSVTASTVLRSRNRHASESSPISLLRSLKASGPRTQEKLHSILCSRCGARESYRFFRTKGGKALCNACGQLLSQRARRSTQPKPPPRKHLVPETRKVHILPPAGGEDEWLASVSDAEIDDLIQVVEDNEMPKMDPGNGHEKPSSTQENDSQEQTVTPDPALPIRTTTPSLQEIQLPPMRCPIRDPITVCQTQVQSIRTTTTPTVIEPCSTALQGPHQPPLLPRMTCYAYPPPPPQPRVSGGPQSHPPPPIQASYQGSLPLPYGRNLPPLHVGGTRVAPLHRRTKDLQPYVPTTRLFRVFDNPKTAYTSIISQRKLWLRCCTHARIAYFIGFHESQAQRVMARLPAKTVHETHPSPPNPRELPSQPRVHGGDERSYSESPATAGQASERPPPKKQRDQTWPTKSPTTSAAPRMGPREADLSLPRMQTMYMPPILPHISTSTPQQRLKLPAPMTKFGEFVPLPLPGNVLTRVSSYIPAISAILHAHGVTPPPVDASFFVSLPHILRQRRNSLVDVICQKLENLLASSGLFESVADEYDELRLLIAASTARRLGSVHTLAS